MIKIIVTRDSVCAGDDFDPPHEKKFRFRENELLKIALQQLMADYLPKIAGGKATWVVQTSIPLAVMAQEWKEPAMIQTFTSISEVFKAGTLTQLYFEYLAQEDPEIVLQRIKEQNSLGPAKSY